MKQVVALFLIATGFVTSGARASAQQPGVPRPTPLAPPAVTLQPPDPPGMAPRSGTYREPSVGTYAIRSGPLKKPAKKPRRHRGSEVFIVGRV
jgi:hypothetical protein